MADRETLLLLVLVLSLSQVVNTFKPLIVFDGKSVTHREITQRAILRKTAEVCRDIATSQGHGFSLTIDDTLSAEEVQRACATIGTSTSILSAIEFYTAIATMYLSNAAVDVVFLLSDRHHFDAETFKDGRQIITTGVSAVKASAKRERFVAGRLILGGILHTLQDFYSHSNWVELGKNAPYSTLIKPDQPLENLAGNTPTCQNCTGGNCENNLLPEVLQQGLLTSGYFNIFSSAKPPGKCSHGGSFDQTSRQDPVGGINKDTVGSSHGPLHPKAADLAVNASMELLEDIRAAVGDKNFLELMGLSQSSVLCFVIDTTGSMSDDIAEAKRVSFSIIDSRRGTLQEPSAYILVPFNDPDFGPLIVTTNADVFKEHINSLTASGGGDIPEMALSGLQLALTAAPDSSDIFVFTDAPAKDSYLKSTITALIESRKSVVTFMLTDVGTSRRRRSPRALSQTDAQLYKDLARASGGQAIEISKSDLSQATKIIEDSSASAVVTVIQVVKNPGRPDNFTFTVDGSLSNVTVYITGASTLTFRLVSATGESQTSSQSSGPLASITTAGNLRRLSLNTDNQTGSWEIQVDSTSQYSVKVTGQSSVNFIFNLVKVHEGAHADFSLMEGRPLSGDNVSLLLSVTGGGTVNITDVTLFDSSGPTQVNGSLQSLGGGDFLVTFSAVPAGDFVVCLRGEDRSSTSRSSANSFERQASTQIKTSNIIFTTEVNNTSIEPGSTISLPFTVATTTNGVVNTSANGTFTVRANNDRGYSLTSPSTVNLAAGGTVNDTVSMTVPASATSGTDVTLTIEAEDTATSDINYTVLRFSVVAEVTDITRPVCQVVNSSTNCSSSSSSSSLCASSMWEFTANFTDGINGTGIESVTIRQGNGTLTRNTVAGEGGENVTVVTYSSSCCSESAELIAVDGIGNVGTCTLRGFTPEVAAATTAGTTAGTTAAVNTTSTGGHSLDLSNWLWISAAVCLFWK